MPVSQVSPARQVNSHSDHDPAASLVDGNICVECGKNGVQASEIRSLMLLVFLEVLVLALSNFSLH